MEIPIEVSAKHIHLSREHLDALFGEAYDLTQMKDLSQPGGFAAEEKVELISDSGKSCKLRVVGPLRNHTQIEISMTDAFKLGIDAPVRESGHISGSASGVLEGPAGEVKLEEGIIIAKRHIHANNSEANSLGIKNGDIVSVKTESKRGVTFHDVVVRMGSDYKLSMHVDTDEGNSAGVPKGGRGRLIT